MARPIANAWLWMSNVHNFPTYGSLTAPRPGTRYTNAPGRPASPLPRAAGRGLIGFLDLSRAGSHMFSPGRVPRMSPAVRYFFDEDGRHLSNGRQILICTRTAGL